MWPRAQRENGPAVQFRQRHEHHEKGNSYDANFLIAHPTFCQMARKLGLDVLPVTVSQKQWTSTENLGARRRAR